MTKKHIIFIIVLTLIGVLTFVSLALAQGCPSITTVAGTTVNFVGEITDMGGEATVTAWFEYGQSTSYGQKTPEKTLSQLGIYCITVSNLNHCTTYHYRAVAQNSAGTSYGNDKTFTTTCGPTVDIKANGSDGPISVSYGNQVNLSWTSSNANSCQAFDDWSGSKSVSGSQTVYSLTSSKTFTLNCTGPAGSASDSVIINVSSASLSVFLSSSPSSGCVPLNGVDFTASVSRTGTGDITYFFDCTNDGTWDRIVTNSYNSYTAYNVCNFGSIGNYTAKVRVESQGVSAENTANINVLSCYSSPTVDLKVNGYDSSVTIPYNTSATLTWTSTNANSCSASGNWSGSKPISGSESTGNLTSSRSYTLTCSGAGGSNTDSVTVSVVSVQNLSVNKLGRNLSKGTSYLDTTLAEPLDVVSFSISIIAGNSQVDNVIVTDVLSDKIVWRQNSLKLDGFAVSGNINSGYNIGTLSANQTRTITFDADIVSADKFTFGDTQLINSVIVSGTNASGSDTAKIVVNRKAVAGATTVPTGLTNNLLVDSFLIPLAIALFLIWLFKSRIIKWEQWLDAKKRIYREYKSDKVFRLKAKKIRIQEFLKRKLM